MTGAPHSINPCGNPASTTQGTVLKVKVMLHTMMARQDCHLGTGCMACVSPNRSEAHPCIPWDALLFLFLLLQFHLSFQTSDIFSLLVNLSFIAWKCYSTDCHNCSHLQCSASCFHFEFDLPSASGTPGWCKWPLNTFQSPTSGITPRPASLMWVLKDICWRNEWSIVAVLAACLYVFLCH